ncbi:MAG: hypothetical protein HQ579_06060, partial [Candidatus Omnitrophica bacterium]|nr:hypothetical protein [Candidatus Omnitrophota bacterium]
MPEDIKMQDAPERAEEQEELEIPAYEDRLELKEEDKKRLSKQINLELDEIKKEYEKKGFV